MSTTPNSLPSTISEPVFMSSAVSSPASTPSRAVLPTSGNARSSSAGGSTRRQRVLWDSDSTTRGGKTSIAILLEWLMAPGNFVRWRDGKSQTGETRETLCSEIKSAMRQHGIHHRENANIRTQISELERSFDAARNWLKENGYDPYTFKRADEETEDDDDGVIVVDGPHGPAEAHVLRMCRYYHALNEVFGHDDDNGVRPRRQRTAAMYPAQSRKRKLSGEEETVQKIEPRPIEMMEEDHRVQLGAGSENVTIPVQVPVATTVSVAAAAAPVTSAVVSTPVPIAANTAMPTATWANSAALESTQRMLTEAVREERERKRFCMEEERSKLECEKLRYEVEAAKLQLMIDRALARKKLLDAGLPEAQVNELFPN